MTRPTLTESADGIYRPLDQQIEERMRPVEQKRPSLVIQILWGYGTFLTGLGVGLAMIVAVMLNPVVWVVRKVRRAWR